MELSKCVTKSDFTIFRKAEIVKNFKEYDVNGDGYVEFEEIKKKMSPQGFSDADIRIFFDKYDLDKDGRLNYTEFAKFWDIPIYWPAWRHCVPLYVPFLCLHGNHFVWRSKMVLSLGWLRWLGIHCARYLYHQRTTGTAARFQNKDRHFRYNLQIVQ